MRGTQAGALLLVAGLGVTSCTNDESSTDDSPAAAGRSSVVASTSESPAKPGRTSSYSYTLKSSCGYGPPHGTFAVIERDGAIESVEAIRGSQPQPGDIPTLKEMIAKAADARPTAKVDLIVDRSGLPVFVKVDNLPERAGRRGVLRGPRPRAARRAGGDRRRRRPQRTMALGRSRHRRGAVRHPE